MPAWDKIWEDAAVSEHQEPDVVTMSLTRVGKKSIILFVEEEATVEVVPCRYVEECVDLAEALRARHAWGNSSPAEGERCRCGSVVWSDERSWLERKLGSLLQLTGEPAPTGHWIRSAAWIPPVFRMPS